MRAHLSIRAKVLGLVTMRAVICLGLSRYLIAQFKATDDLYSNLIENEVAFALKVERVRGDLANMGREFNNLLLPGATGLPALSDRLRGILEKAQQDLRQIEGLSPPGHSADIAGLRAEVAQVASGSARLYQIKAGGDHAGAIAYYRANEMPILVRAFNKLATIADSALMSIDADSARVSKGTESAVWAASLLLGGTTLLSLLAGAAVAVFGVTRPLQQLAARMTTLAGGDTVAPVPGITRGDELGPMAKTVQSFRDGLAEAERLRLEQKAIEVRLGEDKRRAVQELADNVGRSLGAVSQALSGASPKLTSSTGSLSRIAGSTLQQAAQAASGAQQTSANVQGVAEAATFPARARRCSAT